MNAQDEAAIAALIPLSIAHVVQPGHVERLAWHLFLIEHDPTHPPTITGAYRQWNCPRTGASRREALRREAVALLEAALTDGGEFPVPKTDGMEIGVADNGEVLYADLPEPAASSR